MSYTTTIIEQFLSFVPQFNQLPQEAIASLANKLKPLRYRMGQVMIMREKMQGQVLIISEGQARLLGYDPRTKMPTTLELLKPGQMIGWVNLARGIPCETAMASTEVVCLTLSNQDFVEILEQYPQLKQEFRNKPAKVEVFELLGNQLEQYAQGDLDLKSLAQEMAPETKIYELPPGEHPLKSEITAPLEDPDLIWLVSSGAIEDFPVGKRLEFTKDRQTIKITGTKPARLLAIPKDKWFTNQKSQSTGLLSVKSSTVADDDESNLDDTNREEIPYAEAELLEDSEITDYYSSEGDRTTAAKNYPFYGGKTPLDVGVACFQMLSRYFKMPFRKEVIRRVLGEQIQRTGGLSLPLSGAIVELMGLNAQLVTIPATSFTRLQGPCLVRWDNSLAVVYEISEKELIIAVPELGLLRRKPEEFFETWGDRGEVLLLQKTKETPQERFGLNWFLPALTKYKRILIEVFVASFFIQLFALANPLMIQIIIDKVISQNTVETLKYLIFFLIVLNIFEAVLTTLRTYLFVDTTNRIDMSLGSEIIDHLLRLPLRYFEKRPVGEISTRINELERIRQFLTGTALTVVLDSVFSVLYVVVMFLYSPILTFVTLAIIPIFVILTLIFSPTIRQQLRAKAERNAETQSYLVEVLTGIQTVKAQNIELRSRWQWQERYARYISTGFKTVITSTLASSASSFLNNLSRVLIIGVGAYLVLEQKLTLGQLIAFRIIAGYVTSPIMRLAQLWQNFQETALSLERLADIVDHPDEAEQDRTNIPMPAIKGKVRYDNVSFRFKANGPLQLSNVSLEFPAGKFIAIVGESGAGKSTLTKLISRLYEPEMGRILIDGYDIHKVELYSLRRQIGVVPQDTLLFEGSIQENIALTNPDATTEEIIAAAQIAAAHEFIMSLPNGYNTRVGERGSSLSGGQRQRIAIARTVLQQPAILVLDEATSALDYSTEQEVSRNLKESFQGRSVFFITHRLGTIKNADIIVMMDSGSVVEQGTHEELMALKGRYCYLYQQQESSV
ncbi:cyclic nucleotide-regulated ABC bacteriocin/lantibiotic exporter [Stanieria cyanosphaera PCC 7437]|uniref:Cyclic nucleotide-regulated ABC bacteriocin/lantibiotic exporter n=1 Tax=Stanieria cyanosphaera (strain ATCC 29371 / PCC 7437) TaxID=111780 RepID=K9XTU4_STAC7|nr:peptidase domain-containing ABC transporter [Stanieria cyanosphaera]AFZ35484.1 cyclic nucleotide-regulated ABC bacteriocin/lantibiotic exporter [Stanieria cyanosphaera PCC 7437]